MGHIFIGRFADTRRIATPSCNPVAKSDRKLWLDSPLHQNRSLSSSSYACVCLRNYGPALDKTQRNSVGIRFPIHHFTPTYH
ncbi:hypothetical protein CEXT_81361 [Caerostris extrusa]|uniref:Uncharacterized protein n=1 Tax=Caerostris extrusa TaxID=172846 RepID=A0AAV4PCM2_CAEEX|nr:hypothetical protein CEXT_81361 [Caerostris extrusa]